MIYHKGYLLAVEGGEGVGKTTQVELLTAELVERGYEVVHVRAPGGTPFGEDLRTVFKTHYGSVSKASELAILAAAKLELINQVIKPALEAGKIVITDRFTLSTYVYQGIIGGAEWSTIDSVFKVLGVNLKANRTFVFTCDPAISVTRLELRKAAGGEYDAKLDSLDASVHERFNSAYIRATENFMSNSTNRSGNFSVIDVGLHTPQELHQTILAQVDRDLRGLTVQHLTVERHAH